jgi:hypothetical protein
MCPASACLCPLQSTHKSTLFTCKRASGGLLLQNCFVQLYVREMLPRVSESVTRTGMKTCRGYGVKLQPFWSWDLNASEFWASHFGPLNRGKGRVGPTANSDFVTRIKVVVPIAIIIIIIYRNCIKEALWLNDDENCFVYHFDITDQFVWKVSHSLVTNVRFLDWNDTAGLRAGRSRF